jgi:DNA ligase-4
VVECKFDGERIQCHVNGTHLNFFSRNFNDHAEVYRDAIGDDIIKQTNSSRCATCVLSTFWDKCCSHVLGVRRGM